MAYKDGDADEDDAEDEDVTPVVVVVSSGNDGGGGGGREISRDGADCITKCRVGNNYNHQRESDTTGPVVLWCRRLLLLLLVHVGLLMNN